MGITVPDWKIIAFPGELFVSALKAIAPLLVFVLVASAISKARNGIGSRFKTVIVLYLNFARIPRLLKSRMNRKFRGTFIFTNYLQLFF